MVAPPGAVTNPEEFLCATDCLSLHLKLDTLTRLREMPAAEKVTAHTYLATLSGVCCSISSARIVAFDDEEHLRGELLGPPRHRPVARPEQVRR